MTRDVEPSAKPAPSPSAPRPTSAVHAALLVVQIAFATLPIEGKIVMSPPYNVAPQALAMTRILGGAGVFVLAYALSKSAPKVTSWRDRFTLALLAIFGVALNQALFLYGLSRTSPMSATLLIATIPVFTSIFAVLAGRDRMTLRTGLGLVLAVFGVIVLSGFAVPATGDLFVLLNAASYAVYVVFSKSSFSRHGTLAAMAWIFGAATILFAPIGGAILVRDVQHWTLEAFAYVAFVVLVPTVFAYGLNAWALARANPTLVTIYVYFQPLVVLLLSAVQLHQTPKTGSLIGGLFILAGVTTVAIRKSQEGSKPSTNRT